MAQRGGEAPPFLKPMPTAAGRAPAAPPLPPTHHTLHPKRPHCPIQHPRLLLQRVRGRRGLFDQRGILLRHTFHLIDRLVHLLDASALLVGSRSNLPDQIIYPPDRPLHVAHRLTRLRGLHRALADRRHRIVDQPLDLLGRGRRALGQTTHLPRHHRKPSSLLPGPRRLHRGVQRQDIGLERNALDQRRDLGDLGRAAMQIFHRVNETIDHRHSRLGDIVGLERQRVRLARVIGVLPHRDRQLRHAGSRLLERRRLLRRARRQIRIAAGNLPRRRAHRRRRLLHQRHRLPNPVEQLIECRGRIPNLVHPRHRRPHGKVERCIHLLDRRPHALEPAPHHAAQQSAKQERHDRRDDRPADDIGHRPVIRLGVLGNLRAGDLRVVVDMIVDGLPKLRGALVERPAGRQHLPRGLDIVGIGRRIERHQRRAICLHARTIGREHLAIGLVLDVVLFVVTQRGIEPPHRALDHLVELRLCLRIRQHEMPVPENAHVRHRALRGIEVLEARQHLRLEIQQPLLRAMDLP